ncbi:DEAD/DEAH box helicase [Oceanobacter antarcticus]|uniref:DEAD/DEAH box helicase n=1 Tax=Oceanobacter antarcticus TaxID=3133425 RepID=A0ABW8NDR2_9GAMM
MFTDYPLNARLALGLEKLSLEAPTEVQQAVLPLALAGKDIQVCAETGSGKTLAYLLPVMQGLLDRDAPNSATRALIMCPTRELATQVTKVCQHFCDLTTLSVGQLCGGEEFQYQAALLRKNPELIIATPGRLVDHLKRGTCDLGDLEYLILDEADRMLDMGFAEDMDIIRRACNNERQTMLLSATLRHEGVGRIAANLLKNPEEITTHTIQEQHGLITQQRILADDNAHKDRLIAWLLAHETYEKALIFVNKRTEVERLSEFVRRHRNGVAMLHGEMTQDERKYVMQTLREGKRNILVATDVAARGLDVEGMDLVINYDLARKGDEYVHRIGRTGRAGKSGLAISLISPYEWNLKAAIESYIQVVMEARKIEGLVAVYKGPKKLKASGKAASVGKRKPKTKAAPSGRDGKPARTGPRPSRPAVAGSRPAAGSRAAEGNRPAAVGSRPSTRKSNVTDGEGFAPLHRKKPTE